LECLKTSYDITEPQPQLFVTPDFKTLSKVLNEMADQMAFRQGGLVSVQKAIRAENVNTVELDSGIQISGKCVDVILAEDKKTIIYLRFQGPSQLCYKDQELAGHGPHYHAGGFGTALGRLQSSSWTTVLEKMGSTVHLEFSSGVKVNGILKSKVEKDGKLLIVSFDKCSVQYKDQVLFEPPWGIYDLAIGNHVTSVFGGPADREKFGQMDDFVAARVPEKKLSQTELTLYKSYQKVRDLREKKIQGDALVTELTPLIEQHRIQFPFDWLLLLECYELLLNRAPQDFMTEELQVDLKKFFHSHPEKKSMIEDGLSLAHQL
jgi:phenylalanine-4-hydroxylase